MQGLMAHEDKIVPSLRNLTHGDKSPDGLDADWVAPNAVLIGDVKLNPGSSVWHGVTMRGYLSKSTVGINSMI